MLRCAPSQRLGLQTFSVVALATTSSTVRPEDLGGLDFDAFWNKKARRETRSHITAGAYVHSMQHRIDIDLIIHTHRQQMTAVRHGNACVQ